MVGKVDLRPMPTCSDCANYTEKGQGTGECRMAGPVPGDRDADRCPVRLFVPKPLMTGAAYRDPVDDPVVVVADEERAVGEDGEPGRPAEDSVSVVKEAREEVVVPLGLARGREAEPGDGVAVRRVPVPGAVEGHERVAAVLLGERRPVVEPELDWRGVGREFEHGGLGGRRERLLRGAGRVEGRESWSTTRSP